MDLQKKNKIQLFPKKQLERCRIMYYKKVKLFGLNVIDFHFQEIPEWSLLPCYASAVLRVHTP